MCVWGGGGGGGESQKNRRISSQINKKREWSRGLKTMVFQNTRSAESNPIISDR